MTNSSEERLLELYQCLAAIPLQSFRRWAEELLQRWLHCDVANWSICAAAEFDANNDASCGWTAAVSLPHTATGVANVFRLSRRDSHRLFTDNQQQQFADFARHILAAWQLRLRLALQDTRVRQNQTAVAIVSVDGTLECATTEFYALVRSEFAGWSGAGLPAALQEIGASDRIHMLGNHGWSIQHAGDLRVISAAQLGVRSRLSLHQQTIANAILSGASHLETAEQMKISPNTVRNTVARMYRKLNVHNRIEFARRMQLQPVR